jgi:hypothetical protein
MLRAARTRLPKTLLLPVLSLAISCLIGTTASLAGPERGHAGQRGQPALTGKGHVVPVEAGRGDRRHMGGHAGRWHGFPYGRRYFGPGSVFLETTVRSHDNQATIRDESAAAARRYYGPISFADIPASAGISAAPKSPPLFMRINGREVVADDGERYLWRAGPKIVDLGNPAGQRRARQGQPRQAYADMTRLDAPKIIVIRP